MKENFVLTKANSWRMFNQISPKYDFLNHMLSLGLDVQWRKSLVNYIPQGEGLKLLDLATGTADVPMILIRHSPSLESAVGIDLADKMLEVGREKLKKQQLDHKIALQHGDANEIPFDNETFDVTTMAFGIRNVEDPVVVMQEMYRILNKNGRALILEFSLPQNILLKMLHLFYLKVVVPCVGGLISGNYKAYRYLNQTIENFPYGEKFYALMKEAGFRDVSGTPLLFGIATIYQGTK